MFKKIKDFFNSVSNDMMEEDYKRIKENPSTLEKAIRDNKLDEFVATVETVGELKKAKAKHQDALNAMLASDDTHTHKQTTKKGSINNMYTRDFIRYNVSPDMAKAMTWMSKPARTYKIKKTISRQLFKW